MTATKAFRVDPQKVIYEVIEGEAIIIQLELGNYYSLSGSGPAVLGMLAAGLPVHEVCTRLSARHPDHEGEIQSAVERLVDELAAEGLLEADGSDNQASAGGPGELDAAGGDFRPPVLEKYTDMQDFLLVDPIHGVGEEGWPSPKPDG